MDARANDTNVKDKSTRCVVVYQDEYNNMKDYRC